MRDDARRAEGRQGMTSAMALVAPPLLASASRLGVVRSARAIALAKSQLRKVRKDGLHAGDLNHACVLK
jgi:hypothetical protein